MAGREDYGVLRSQLPDDPRTYAAADLYVANGIASARTSIGTVCGHIAMLGLWALRETDDGTLPGDAIPAICSAVKCDRETAKVIRECLRNVGLLKPLVTPTSDTRQHDVTPTSDGHRMDVSPTSYCTSRPTELRLAGFEEAFEAVLARRRSNAASARRRRQRDVGMTSDTRRTPTEPNRTESPPSPSPGESGVPSAEPQDDGPLDPARPLRPRDRERFAKVLDYAIRCGASTAERAVAYELRRRNRLGEVADAEIATALTVTFRWVTREMLARSLDHADDGSEKPAAPPPPVVFQPATGRTCSRHGRLEPCSVCETLTAKPADPAVAAKALADIRAKLNAKAAATAP